MKVAIVGSRSITNYKLIKSKINELIKTHNIVIKTIISGGAYGVDFIAEQYATENRIPIKIFLPDWNTYGKSAGFKRNTTIIENCDICIAFWDGISKGTLDSVNKAKKLNKQVYLIEIK